MSKSPKPSNSDPSWFDVDAMRAINAPRVLGNNDKPLFGLGVAQPTFGPRGVRRSHAFGDEAFAAPTSAPGKIVVEMFKGPADPQEKIREQPPNVPENVFDRLGRPAPFSLAPSATSGSLRQTPLGDRLNRLLQGAKRQRSASMFMSRLSMLIFSNDCGASWLTI